MIRYIGISLGPTWISNNIHYYLWNEITYPFQNFNGATVDVREWLSNFIRHFINYVITYPRWNLSSDMLVKGAPCARNKIFLGTLMPINQYGAIESTPHTHNDHCDHLGWNNVNHILCVHYSDIIMNAIASQITGVSIVCSSADQRKH